jgi:hypothetical protein
MIKQAFLALTSDFNRHRMRQHSTSLEAYQVAHRYKPTTPMAAKSISGLTSRVLQEIARIWIHASATNVPRDCANRHPQAIANSKRLRRSSRAVGYVAQVSGTEHIISLTGTIALQVFAVLWHEHAGGGRSNTDRSRAFGFTLGPMGQEIYSHIIRMVVVKELHGFCWCL